MSSRRKIGEWIHKDSAFTSNGSISAATKPNIRGENSRQERFRPLPVQFPRDVSISPVHASSPSSTTPSVGYSTLCRARGSIHDPAIFRIEQHSVTMLRNELLRLELREGELSFNLAKQVEKLCVLFKCTWILFHVRIIVLMGYCEYFFRVKNNKRNKKKKALEHWTREGRNEGRRNVITRRNDDNMEDKRLLELTKPVVVYYRPMAGCHCAPCKTLKLDPRFSPKLSASVD